MRWLASQTGGDFSVYLDASHGRHVISPHVLETVILPALERDGAAVRLLDAGDVGYGYPGSTHGMVEEQGRWDNHDVGFGGWVRFAAATEGAATRFVFPWLTLRPYVLFCLYEDHSPDQKGVFYENR